MKTIFAVIKKQKNKTKKVFEFHVFILRHAIFLFKAYIMTYLRLLLMLHKFHPLYIYLFKNK